MNTKELRAFINKRWVKEDTSDLIKRIIRRIIGVALIAAFPTPFVGIGLMLLGVLLIAPDIAALLSRPLDGLLWPNRQRLNQPYYSKADAMLINGKVTEAEKAYQEILEEFPQELKAHAALLRIATVENYDLEKATEYHEQALNSLKKESDQDQITLLYHSYLQNAGRHPNRSGPRTQYS